MSDDKVIPADRAAAAVKRSPTKRERGEVVALLNSEIDKITGRVKHSRTTIERRTDLSASYFEKYIVAQERKIVRLRKVRDWLAGDGDA